MNTLLTIAFFAALALLNWYLSASCLPTVKVALRLYGSLFLGGLCVATLVSPYLLFMTLVAIAVATFFLLVGSEA